MEVVAEVDIKEEDRRSEPDVVIELNKDWIQQVLDDARRRLSDPDSVKRRRARDKTIRRRKLCERT